MQNEKQTNETDNKSALLFEIVKKKSSFFNSLKRDGEKNKN